MSTEEIEAKVRGSYSLSEEYVRSVLTNPRDYDTVLHACARNAKHGPFTATSGVILPFYLNAGTNFLDKMVAPTITRVLIDILADMCTKGGFTADNRALVVGMEVAGGIMASQIAAVAAVYRPEVVEKCDFVYCRKKRKTSGTCQQLEGPQFITTRTAESPVARAFWLDDANSTGSSLRDGVQLLKQEYNIEVETALYLVDRSADRKSLPIEKIGLADPSVTQGVTVAAVYDLAPIAAIIADQMAGSNGAPAAPAAAAAGVASGSRPSTAKPDWWG